MKKTMLLVIMLTLFASTGLFSDWTELQKILASDGADGDFFGKSVSIDGDYAVIGAICDCDHSGSAYIFHRIGNTWTEQAKITASDGEGGDYFGHSVSIAGDYVVISADWDDDNGHHSGSAYIFHRIGTIWTEQAKITASDGASHDYFGQSVSIDGDFVVVGAWGDDDNGEGTGSAYIFNRIGTTWSQQIKITASDGEGGDHFGMSVSIAGDYVVVGAYGSDGSGSNPSSAYIFHRIESIWSEQAEITASDATNGDCFGKSVSISGDYALIGAYLDQDNGVRAGSAYIFHRIGTIWTEQAKITASDGASSDYFGLRVSLSGDYALIGAYKDDDDGSESGSAYIFHRSGAIWTEQVKLTASDGAFEDRFGLSVSISGNYALISAYYDDDNGSDSGSAYIYYNEPSTPVELSAFTAVYTDGSSLLQWTTQSESNNQGWNIYRSQTVLEDAVQINGYLIPGAGTTSEPTEYTYRDIYNLEENNTYYYWLESRSFSGDTDIHGPISLTIESPGIDELPDATVLYSAYPNPFKPETTIKFSIKETETAELTIYNVKGQRIISENFEAGIYQYKWNADKYSPGIYFYKLETKSYSKINKMVMMK